MKKTKKITVYVYDKMEQFDSKKDAVDFFQTAMMWCDPASSEYNRYSHIVQQLLAGRTICKDLGV